MGLHGCAVGGGVGGLEAGLVIDHGAHHHHRRRPAAGVPALRGQTVTFSFTVISNNLYAGPNGHVSQAFVKTLDSGNGYQLVPGAYQFVTLTNNATSYPVSITVNTAPPSGGQSTVSVPPCASTMPRLTARPTPVPEGLVVK